MEYYTYAYLREDGTPYYIGKGKGYRAYKKGSREFTPPKDSQRILILKKGLTEEDAFKHEIYMIAVFGRKDTNTGILHNKTNGGDGCSGSTYIPTEEHKEKIRQSRLGKKRKPFTEEHKAKLRLSLDKHRHKIKPPILTGKSNGVSKTWRIVFSDGRETIQCGLALWCKENGYTKGALYKVASGKWERHKDIVTVEEVAQEAS